ncbi:hypothetical protein JD844_008218 [Phrynosoma platyrhinos]|uniref:Uncharacterized protein n=1 Tax=Phrynosoma platyrhinos TaxID=52577 RepID=A0ABQ7TDR3_PHRPL|nr:hypothetical protein JD844_008218 [Phrynosoma platyrhinos]
MVESLSCLEVSFILCLSEEMLYLTLQDLCSYSHHSFPLLLSRLILDGAPLIAIHKARYYKRKDGLALGPGPFVTGLEYATDVKATVVGKPEQTFFLEALRGTNCVPEEAIMIGDIVKLLRKYREADEGKINPPPYLTCESFPQAVDHILQHLL